MTMDSLTGVLLLLLFPGVLGQQIRVDPEVMSYPGQTVELPCQFIKQGNTQLTQVSWILEPSEGERINVAVYHPTFGPNYPDSPVKGRVAFTQPSLETPSIRISDVKMTDEGRYICEYATYPSGNAQGITQLVMLAKPQNSASTVTVVAGDKVEMVAQCVSSHGRPAARIRWVTSAVGNGSTTSVQESDNTVTVRSIYRMVPTPDDNGKDISCVVDHRTQAKPDSHPMKLAIEFKPIVKVVGYDNNWYMGRTNVELTCQARGNPIPTTVKWSMHSGLMPDTVQVSGNKLKVLKVDERINTTFVCEVQNRVGKVKDQVTIYVRDPPADPSNAGVVAGVVIGSLLALLLVGALVAILVTHSRRQQQDYRGNQKSAVFDIKSRLFGPKASKNGGGSGGHGGGHGNGAGNNYGPVYTYREGVSEGGLTEKANQGPGGMALLSTTPTAQDILLSGEMDEAERRKFDALEDEEDDDERYDHFNSSTGPILQLRHHDDPHSDYLDDDMESQRDGSVISRTAVYV